MEKIKRVEALITTVAMKQPLDLIKRMNIQTSAMIGNQTDYNQVSEYVNGDLSYKIYSFKERGVGLNRNNLLMRTDAEYCLFGDDDLVYVDGYEQMILEEFNKYPDADVLLFNLEEQNSKRYKVKKVFKVNYLNCMRFGAARMAVRVRNVRLNGVLFNTSFGGGTPYSNGEDTLFLVECLKNKLKLIAVPKTIAKLTSERESTWFTGYNDKYFNDKGVLYYVMSKRLYRLLCLQDAMRHNNLYKRSSFYEVYRLMMQGVAKVREE